MIIFILLIAAQSDEELSSIAISSLKAATGLSSHPLSLPSLPFVHRNLRGPVVAKLVLIGVGAERSEGDDGQVGKDDEGEENEHAGGGLHWLEYGEAHAELSVREEKNALFVAARLLLYGSCS